MIRSVAFARHRRAFDQEMLCPTLDNRTTRGAVTYPRNCPAVEGIGSTSALYLIDTMQRAFMSVAYKYNRVHWFSPSDGAVRDSRSMSAGHTTFGAKQCMWLRPSSSFQSRGGCTNFGKASGPCCMNRRAMAQ